MTVQIVKQTDLSITVNAGGQEVHFIWIGKDYVTVIVNNASHRVYRGMGKQFKNLEAALEHYKGKKVRAAIECAIAATTEQTEEVIEAEAVPAAADQDNVSYTVGVDPSGFNFAYTITMDTPPCVNYYRVK